MPLHEALSEVVGRQSLLISEAQAVCMVEGVGGRHDYIFGVGWDKFTLEIVRIEDWLDINML